MRRPNPELLIANQVKALRMLAVVNGQQKKLRRELKILTSRRVGRWRSLGKLFSLRWQPHMFAPQAVANVALVHRSSKVLVRSHFMMGAKKTSIWGCSQINST